MNSEDLDPIVQVGLNLLGHGYTGFQVLSIEKVGIK